MRNCWNGFAALAFPPSCALCEVRTAGDDFCLRCRIALVADASRSTCRRCAASIGPYLDPTECIECREQSFAFDGATRLGCYDGALKTACGKLKAIHGSRLATKLADILFEARREHWQELRLDVVVPASLHVLSRALRGYDQSAHLARQLARRLRLPFCRALRRRRFTAKQVQLSATDRRANLRNAFICRQPPWVTGKNVLLVDDVMTTCSTCHEAARALKKAGTASVHVAVLARTSPTAKPKAGNQSA